MTMAQLWGGRFTKQTDQLVFDFNASITFDKRLFHEDVTGSIVHATMLAKQGILTEEERKSIVEGLTGILEDVDDGTLAIDETQEDIHSFVEATLIDRIGDAGKKLHTGRSRNDQVALDMRLYTRARVACACCICSICFLAFPYPRMAARPRASTTITIPMIMMFTLVPEGFFIIAPPSGNHAYILSGASNPSISIHASRIFFTSISKAR